MLQGEEHLSPCFSGRCTATARQTSALFLVQTRYLINLIFLGTGFYILLLTVSVTNLLCMTTAPVRCRSLFQAGGSDCIAGLGVICTSAVRQNLALAASSQTDLTSRRPHRAIHSTLCSRVLLNLRKAAARSSGVSWDEFNKRSELAFERRFSDIGEDSFITLTDLER